MKTLLAFLILVVLSVSAFSQEFDKAKLDQFFDGLAANDKGMGSLAIAKDGKIIYSRAVGISNIGDKGYVNADAKTKYRIGSITKTFTAVLILQLVEEGKLKLDDTLDKFYPEIPNAKKITIAQMLNHRSGIHNFTSDRQYFRSYYRRPQTHEQMVAVIAKTAPDFEPGTKMNYSNSGYLLLGYIVEKLSGKSYADVLKEKITSKLNLSDTYYGGKINGANGESGSFDFLRGNWKMLSETDMSVSGGAGAIVSTPTDLTKFIAGLFDGKLVSQNSLASMKTMTDGYGLGMFQIPFGEKKFFGHNGGIDGFNSMLGYQPEDKLAVAYISNGTVYSVNDIMIAALTVSYNKPFEVPSFKPLTLSAADLDKFTGVYATEAFPLKITFIVKNNKLYGQATGQRELPFEATDKNKFSFEPAGIFIEFDAEKSTMTLKQGGRDIVFTKEK